MDRKEEAAAVAAPPKLAPPVQLVVRCTGCGYERTSVALHPQGLEEALRCERCRQPNQVLGHRSMGGPSCPCCSLV